MPLNKAKKYVEKQQTKEVPSLESKVENILKGSLDSISSPSPSVKIQIMGGKACLKCKSKTLLGQQTFCQKVC